MFCTDNFYNFSGSDNLIEDIKIYEMKIYEKINDISLFYLGKFVKYIAVPLHGDIYDEGKAVFENGTINANDFNRVILILQK